MATVARWMEHLRWQIGGKDALDMAHLFADGAVVYDRREEMA